MCPVSKLKFDPEYKSIYAQESPKVKRIAENMELYGYDVSQVIIINPSWHILDGNSRREALDLLEKKIEKVKKTERTPDDLDELDKSNKLYIPYVKYILNELKK